MDEIIKEIISPSGRYKATIIEKQIGYILDFFILSEINDSSKTPKWIKKNKNSVCVGKKYHVEAVAIDELRKLMIEPDLPLTIEWIRDFSFCKDANFLDPSEITVVCDFIDPDNQDRKKMPIEVKTIINFSGLYLVKEVGSEDDWQMGQKDNDGNIHCWGCYGTLKEAIKGL